MGPCEGRPPQLPAGQERIPRARYLYHPPSVRHLPIYGLLTIASLLGAVRLQAQPDELTGEFGKLSAKERARIAQREESEAAADQAFNELMTGAEQLFKAQDYNGALLKYKEARARRPYNVHPKVKIEDLQALIARRQEEQAASVKEAPPPVALPVVIEDPVPPPMPLEAPPQVKDPRAVNAPVADPVKERPVRPPPRESRPDPVVRQGAVEVKPAPTLEEGERVYKEGRSIVVESTVNEEGRLVVYRKVSHPWGEEHYFREGATISERAYRSALPR